MPLSLLCHEFMLNALKHAWPGGAGGALTVEVGTQGDQPQVRISDNGVGFAADEVTRGLGTRLIRSLAKEARVLIDIASAPGSGTCVTMRFQE